MFPVGFEPTISAGQRPHTYALDRAVTGTGNVITQEREDVWPRDSGMNGRGERLL